MIAKVRRNGTLSILFVKKAEEIDNLNIFIETFSGESFEVEFKNRAEMLSAIGELFSSGKIDLTEKDLYFIN